MYLLKPQKWDFIRYLLVNLLRKLKKKKKKIPAGYVGSFYQNLAENVDTFMAMTSMVGLPMILTFPQKIFRNISSQPVILLKECKQI